MTTLQVIDAQSGHGLWPLVALYQLVVLVPSDAAFDNLTAGPRATVFKAAGGGWEFAGYLANPPPGAAPPGPSARATVQLGGGYTPGQRYLIEVPFTGPGGTGPGGLGGSRGPTDNLCATVVISGVPSSPATTTIAG
jgi:hypothetical protein